MNIFQDILPYGVFGKSRAINAENPTGEKGKGGMASSNLGKGRKGSPCLKNVEPGSTTVLADISGCGVINHIWITVDNKTTDGDCCTEGSYFAHVLGRCQKSGSRSTTG